MKKSVLTRALSPQHAAFLNATITRNRALFGGWSMDGSGAGAGGDGGGTGGGQGGNGGQGGDGGGQGGNAGQGGNGGQGGAGSGAGNGNAVDAQGNDLGFPKDTPIAEMNDKQQAAYWRNNSRKHEGLWKGITGDRSADDVKKDLDAYAQLQREQQTPAEQALTDAREQGKQEGIQSVRGETARSTFRGALVANGVTETDVDELVTNFNVDAYVGDEGVDVTKIVNFAKRFTPSGTDNSKNGRRDFGGGNRNGSGGNQDRGAGGKAEAQKRFGTKTA